MFQFPLLAGPTWLTGPLGSGKTRLARELATRIPGASFVDLARTTARRLEEDAELVRRVDQQAAELVQHGATASEDLRRLLASLDSDGTPVVDLVEHHLNAATQRALAAGLRRWKRTAVLMTRSTGMLDPSALPVTERVVFCPANHAPPQVVLPFVGAAGFEAMASCLAPPEVRARLARGRPVGASVQVVV